MAVADIPSSDYVFREKKKCIREDEPSAIHFNLRYDMQQQTRGFAHIFNNDIFQKMDDRKGTRKDRDNLKETFTNLGFKVRVHDDYTASEIRDILLEASKVDHSDFDCFLCVFLTHGDDGIIYGSDGDPESFRDNGSVHSTNRTWLRLNDDVFDIFRGNNCSTLIGKPKIFIIQACRGGTAEFSAMIGSAATDYEEPLETSVGVKVTIPTEADFLISYSSSEGYYSFRELYKGTWFIQDLTRVLNEFGRNGDFIRMLTVVNKLVSERAIQGSGKPELEGKKQMPCFLSKLTRQLHLTAQT
ncbi:caspase-6-like [Apostichopus japonicus]|uniref:caspase-6-like n=1 Tax=Stichopus japonicus TaxID=307972 RepID=UPI003AB608CB